MITQSIEDELARNPTQPPSNDPGNRSEKGGPPGGQIVVMRLIGPVKLPLDLAQCLARLRAIEAKRKREEQAKLSLKIRLKQVQNR
jgi:hypothetical protein